MSNCLIFSAETNKIAEEDNVFFNQSNELFSERCGYNVADTATIFEDKSSQVCLVSVQLK